MNSLDKPQVNPIAVLREEFDDWAVLFNPDTAEAVGVNPVGVAIWKLMDGRRSIEQIASSIAEQFDKTPPTIIDEVREHVEKLASHGFLENILEASGN
jgi:SynChlorMet cassette protein ScmD